MSYTKIILLLIVVCCFQLGPRTVYSKDTFYSLGYGMIQVVDGDTDSIVADIPVDGWTRESDFSADGRFLYVSARRHLIHKIDLVTNQVVNTINVNSDGWERFIYGFSLAPDGDSAYVNLLSRRSRRGDVEVGLPVLAQISLEDGHILRSVEVPWGSISLVPVENATSIYVIGKDIIKVDVSGEKMRITGTYAMFEKKWNILPIWNYTDENGGVFIVNYYTPEMMGLVSIDTQNGEIIDTPLEGEPVFAYSVVRSPDKEKLYAVMDEITVIDLPSRSYEAVVPISEGTNYAINVSSDGKKIYASGAGSTTTIFDAQSLKPIKVLQMKTDGWDFRRLTN